MASDPTVGKLLKLAVAQQYQIDFLTHLLAVTRSPADPEGEHRRIRETMTLEYPNVVPEVAVMLGQALDLPVSPELILRAGPGPEFDTWLRKQVDGDTQLP